MSRAYGNTDLEPRGFCGKFSENTGNVRALHRRSFSSFTTTVLSNKFLTEIFLDGFSFGFFTVLILKISISVLIGFEAFLSILVL